MRRSIHDNISKRWIALGQNCLKATLDPTNTCYTRRFVRIDDASLAVWAVLHKQEMVSRRASWW